MASKMIWFDTETTGLSPHKNDIIQISGIIIAGGAIKEEFNFKCQPFSFENIEPKAIETHGISIEQMEKFPPPGEIFQELKKMFTKYINPYDRNDKFTAAGYNVRFDIDMLNQFWRKNNDNYFFSFVDGYPLDVYYMVIGLHHMGFIPRMENFKLETVCKFYGIPIAAHDALADIKATRELALGIKRMLGLPSESLGGPDETD